MIDVYVNGTVGQDMPRDIWEDMLEDPPKDLTEVCTEVSSVPLELGKVSSTNKYIPNTEYKDNV